MPRKLSLRPSLGDLLSGVKNYGGQGIGRPLSSLTVQVPHVAPDGESVIPTLEVITAMAELDGNLGTLQGELEQAQQDISDAQQQIDDNKTEADQKFDDLDTAVGDAQTQITTLEQTLGDLAEDVSNIEAGEGGVVFSGTRPGPEFENEHTLWIRTGASTGLNYGATGPVGRYWDGDISTVEYNVLTGQRFEDFPSGGLVPNGTTVYDNWTVTHSTVACQFMGNQFGDNPGFSVNYNNGGTLRLEQNTPPPNTAQFRAFGMSYTSFEPFPEGKFRIRVFLADGTHHDVMPSVETANEVKYIKLADLPNTPSGVVEVALVSGSGTNGHIKFGEIYVGNRNVPYFDYTTINVPTGSRWRYSEDFGDWVSASDGAITASARAASLALETANLAEAAAKGMIVLQQDEPTGSEGRVWMVTDEDGNLVGLKQWSTLSNTWVPYRIMADEILVPSSIGAVSIKDGAVTAPKIVADEVAGAVGVFIDAMMENLSVTGVAAIQEVTTDALWAKMAVVERLQVLEEIITTDMIATGAITGSKLTVDSAFISKLVAENGWFGEVTAKKMTSSEFIGGVIQGAVFTTAAPGAANRTYIDTAGMTVHGGGQDLVKIGHGIDSGMAVRWNNEMVPLSPMVFGTEVYSGQGWVPGPPGTWDSYGSWREIKLGTMRFPSKFGALVLTDDKAENPISAYYYDVLVRLKPEGGSSAIADIGRHVLRPGNTNTFVKKFSANTTNMVDVYIVARCARYDSNNPSPTWPTPQIKWDMMVQPI